MFPALVKDNVIFTALKFQVSTTSGNSKSVTIICFALILSPSIFDRYVLGPLGRPAAHVTSHKYHSPCSFTALHACAWGPSDKRCGSKQQSGWYSAVLHCPMIFLHSRPANLLKRDFVCIKSQTYGERKARSNKNFGARKIDITISFSLLKPFLQQCALHSHDFAVCHKEYIGF